MPYCIYTDQEVDQSRGNFDHIVPLSLGGANGFCVFAQRDFNSHIGSKVDGAIANDPLIELARRKADARGHSGRDPVLRWRNSEMEGRPVQTTLSKEKATIWDSRERRTLADAEVEGKPIKSTLHLEIHPSVRFTAKVALGGGFFVYGDLMRQRIDCDELRRLTKLDLEEIRKDPSLDKMSARVCHRFHKDALGASADGSMYRHLCEFTGRTTFLAIPHPNSVAFHIGVLGMYIGSIFMPAETSAFSIDGEHDVGHVILLEPGNMERLPLREFAASAIIK